MALTGPFSVCAGDARSGTDHLSPEEGPFEGYRTGQHDKRQENITRLTSFIDLQSDLSVLIELPAAYTYITVKKSDAGAIEIHSASCPNEGAWKNPTKFEKTLPAELFENIALLWKTELLETSYLNGVEIPVSDSPYYHFSCVVRNGSLSGSTVIGGPSENRPHLRKLADAALLLHSYTEEKDATKQAEILIELRKTLKGTKKTKRH